MIEKVKEMNETQKNFWLDIVLFVFVLIVCAPQATGLAIHVNLILNLLLFIDMILVSYSGVVISEAALPTMGIPVVIDPFGVMLHDITGNLFLVLIGVHLAMHWKWIVSTVKRYVWTRPLTPANRILP